MSSNFIPPGSSKYLRKKASEAVSAIASSSNIMGAAVDSVILEMIIDDSEFNPLLATPLETLAEFSPQPEMDADYIHATQAIIEQHEPTNPREQWREEEQCHEQTLQADSERLQEGLAFYTGKDDLPVLCLNKIPHETISDCYQICNKETQVRCKNCEGIKLLTLSIVLRIVLLSISLRSQFNPCDPSHFS
jgi:hypothetical protein